MWLAGLTTVQELGIVHENIQDDRCDLGDGGLGMMLVLHVVSRADKRRAADCTDTKVSENTYMQNDPANNAIRTKALGVLG